MTPKSLASLIGIGILVVGLAASVARPSAQTQAPDIDTLGPQVGDAMLPFAGTDQFGQPQTLESVMGPNGAMVVFFRSADW